MVTQKQWQSSMKSWDGTYQRALRNFKKGYLKEIQAGKEVQLKANPRGHPLLLGELDIIVQKYIRNFVLLVGLSVY